MRIQGRNMVEHKSTIDQLIAEFNLRNPKRRVIIDYAEGVTAETGYPAEVIIPEKNTDDALILIDVETPLNQAIPFIAKGLGSVEAGFSGIDNEEHYLKMLEFA